MGELEWRAILEDFVQELGERQRLTQAASLHAVLKMRKGWRRQEFRRRDARF